MRATGDRRKQPDPYRNILSKFLSLGAQTYIDLDGPLMDARRKLRLAGLCLKRH
jgi:hypothetical protein